MNEKTSAERAAHTLMLEERFLVLSDLYNFCDLYREPLV
jgi:hypothetical protein